MLRVRVSIESWPDVSSEIYKLIQCVKLYIRQYISEEQKHAVLHVLEWYKTIENSQIVIDRCVALSIAY